jgi:hypothetical protein
MPIRTGESLYYFPPLCFFVSVFSYDQIFFWWEEENNTYNDPTIWKYLTETVHDVFR